MFWLYSVLFTFGLIATAPYYLWRHRGRAWDGWRERLGFLPVSFQQVANEAIWIHAVSVGETLAIVGLVRELKSRYPARKIFLSHVTPTGRETGEQRLPGVTGRFYLPLDWRSCQRRALDRIRPALIIIVETELWPNLLAAARERGARVVLVNARLSERSFRGYRALGLFMRRVLDCVDLVAARSAADANRFCRLGTQAERVAVTGNLKFDARPPELGEWPGRLETALRRAGRSPVLVAASTMPGEEELVLDAWRYIRAHHPRALLILAPRHPARFEEVAKLFARQQTSLVRRTALGPASDPLAEQLALPEVLLLDTLGELAGVLQVADVVFIGGSLVPTGGHNPLEPAYWAKPALFGPHMENFRDTTSLFLEAQAACQVRDSEELGRAMVNLIDDAELRLQMGKRARSLLDRESGATRRVLDRLAPWLDVDRSAPAVPHDRKEGAAASRSAS